MENKIIDELIDFLERRIKLYEENIAGADLSSYEDIMKCHKLACKKLAYEEVISHIKIELTLQELKEK